MRAIKRFLKKCDLFGIPLTFRYKKQKMYSTSLGGLFFVLFCAATIFVEIYYFIPFYNRKNYSYLHYSMNLDKTEQIKLSDSKFMIAIGLNCNVDENGTKAEDILKLEIKYTINKKDKEGRIHKTKETISSHSCNFSDFDNKFNNSLDFINIQNYRCIDKSDYTIEGINTDDEFKYYEFEVTSKEESKSNLDKIDKYLKANDCKLQLYYPDIQIDVHNFKNPIKPFLNSIFIQLNPTLFIKMNAFIMNQYFIDDNFLVYILKDEDPKVKAFLSRCEQYSLYKGLNRFENKIKDYKSYARIYVRADLKKTEIERKYQKIIEFYADSSSIMRGLFNFLLIILNFINNFYAELSLSKKLFFFKDIKNNHIDALKKNSKIKDLIALTERFKNISLENKNQNRIKMKVEKINESRIKQKNVNKKEDINRMRLSETAQIRSDISGEVLVNLNSDNDSKPRDNEKTKELATFKDSKKIKYSFNIFEFFFKSYFSCCLTKKLRFKKNINLKANELLYNKIDIVLFARNMIEFDIINKCFLENNKKRIIKFLSRPIVSINKEEESKIDENHKDFYDYKIDFDKLNNDILKMAYNPKIRKNERKLIFLSNKQLKELIYN